MYKRHTKDEIDEVIAFYSNKHTVKETADEFGLTVNQVNYFVKKRKATNGRTLSEINKQSAQSGAVKAIAKASESFEAAVNALGFDLVSEYKGCKHQVQIRCRKCGTVFERNAKHIKKVGAVCNHCKDLENAARRSEKQKADELKRQQHQAEKQRKADERKANNPLGLSHYQLQREQKLDEVHQCKICGRTYTVRSYIKSAGLKTYSNPGYCSATCHAEYKRRADKKNKKKARANGKRYVCKHYTRAKRLGLPVEEGITLKRLIERDGLTCAICGLPCIYGGDCRSDLYPSIDHIIPLANDPDKLGGHTWDNVQVAHRICNSNKRDYVGDKWQGRWGNFSGYIEKR